MRRIALLLCLAALPLRAEVYRWVDEQGQVHFGDRAPRPGSEPLAVEPNVTGTGGLRRGERDWLKRLRAAEARQRALPRAAASDSRRSPAQRRRCATYRLRLDDYRAERRRGCRIGRCSWLDRRIEHFEALLLEECR